MVGKCSDGLSITKSSDLVGVAVMDTTGGSSTIDCMPDGVAVSHAKDECIDEIFIEDTA